MGFFDLFKTPDIYAGLRFCASKDVCRGNLLVRDFADSIDKAFDI